MNSVDTGPSAPTATLCRSVFIGHDYLLS